MTQLLPVMGFWNPETNAIINQTLMPGAASCRLSSGPSIEGTHRPQLRVKLLHPEAKLPSKVNVDDAGFDLYSIEDVTLQPATDEESRNPLGTLGGEDKSRVIVRTGISVEFAPGLGLFIWDRSGLSAKNGIHRVAGVVDASYRGEIKVALVNLSNTSYQIKKGDRIAQAILMPVILPEIVEVTELSSTQRGAGGFGSTGA